MSSLPIADLAICPAVAMDELACPLVSCAADTPLTRDSANTRTAICAISFLSISFMNPPLATRKCRADE